MTEKRNQLYLVVGFGAILLCGFSLVHFPLRIPLGSVAVKLVDGKQAAAGGSMQEELSRESIGPEPDSLVAPLSGALPPARSRKTGTEYRVESAESALSVIPAKPDTSESEVARREPTEPANVIRGNFSHSTAKLASDPIYDDTSGDGDFSPRRTFRYIARPSSIVSAGVASSTAGSGVIVSRVVSSGISDEAQKSVAAALPQTASQSAVGPQPGGILSFTEDPGIPKAGEPFTPDSARPSAEPAIIEDQSEANEANEANEASEASEPGQRDTDLIVLPAERFVLGFNIAWSANDPANRNIGRGLPRSTWAAFVRLKVEPEIKRGVRRFELHNPWGALAGEPMQLDQFLHAQEAGLDFITEGFVEAWKPVTDRGIEVIAYVGCGLDDPDFDILDEQNDEEGWRNRAMRSIQPALDAGMSIGLDAAVTAARDSPTHQLAKALSAAGTPVYVEAKPTRLDSHWFEFNVIAQDRAWRTADIHNGHPRAKDYGIENEQILGESIRMLSPNPPETWADLKGEAYLERLRSILADGQSVLGGTTELDRLHREVIFKSTPRELPASFD